ncbi:MAG: O-antigen ligase family protein [Acidobacteriota bacterium]
MKNRLGIIRQFDAGSNVATLILLLIACCGPLYFGSVLPRERIALQIGACMALAAVAGGRKTLTELADVKIPALAVAAVGTFGILQSLAYPRFLVELIAPRLAAAWTETAELTGAAIDWIPLSLSPSVSREVGLHWLALAACLTAAGLVGRERRLRHLLAFGVLAVAVFEIVYGSDNWFTQSGTIWGVEVGGDPSRLRGTFVNPDHLALLLIISNALCFAWLWWSVRRVGRSGTIERRLLHAVQPSLIFLMLFVGLAFTGSRAGLLAMVLAVLFQTLMLAVHYRRWQVGLLSSGALVLGLVGIALFGLQKGLGRWMETSAYEIALSSRFDVYQASLDLWLLFPWSGTGLGTFRQAFPLVQPVSLQQTWLHAHNDILELLVTTGLVGLPLMAYGLWALYWRLWKVFQRGRRSADRAAGLGALGAVVGVLIHSCFDFGLTLPANAFTLAIICGLACGTRILPSRRPAPAAKTPAAELAETE